MGTTFVQTRGRQDGRDEPFSPCGGKELQLSSPGCAVACSGFAGTFASCTSSALPWSTPCVNAGESKEAAVRIESGVEPEEEAAFVADVVTSAWGGGGKVAAGAGGTLEIDLDSSSGDEM